MPQSHVPERHVPERHLVVVRRILKHQMNNMQNAQKRNARPNLIGAELNTVPLGTLKMLGKRCHSAKTRMEEIAEMGLTMDSFAGCIRINAQSLAELSLAFSIT